MIQKTIFQQPFNSFNSFNNDIIKPVFGEITPFKKSFKAMLNEGEKQIMEDVLCWGEMDLATHGDQMQFFEVVLQPKVKLSVSRVTIQAFIRRELLPYTAALIVFHYPHNPSEWRISFVSKGRNAADATSAKRYTYLVGDDQACRTVAKRFDELTKKPKTLENITEAFSVDKLSDDFFETYRNIYADFVQHITGKRYVKEKGKWIENTIQEPDEQLQSAFDGDEKSVRDYVKKMMGRLVFLQFLQKKGWLGVPADKPWGEGDQHFLQNLFANSNHKEDFLDEVLEPLLFETLNDGERANEIADARLGENIKIPYLNGGLFESDALDKRKVIFKAELFENLFQFFSEYNFTIDENDPNDAEVGVDPEMLGRIFENLLEDNKDKGAFYTPKEIVQYMCRESLIAYLTTDNESMLEAIKQLVMQHKTESLIPEQKRMLLTKLKAVKVCDPAIGSGAFPMGMLQEIYQCIVALDGKVENTVDIKKHIIQNSIYGVDLEKGAVDIARLRFWLALVVDEEKPQPLPNLDYKIMQGNSLLESFEGVDLSIISDVNDEIMISNVEQLTFGEEFEAPKIQLSIFDKSTKEDLSNLLDRYFDIHGNNNKKESLKRRITDIVDGKIQAHIQQKLRNAFDSFKNLENKWLNAGVSNFDLLDKKSKEYKLYISKKNEAYRLTEVENKLIEFNESSTRPFFLWHLWFKDVFNKGGFNIIIGNPPYVVDKNLSKSEREYFETNYQSALYQINLYLLFIEKSTKLLSDKGLISLIVPNTWLVNKTVSGFRKFYIENYRIRLIADLTKVDVFDATVLPIIFFANKFKQNEDYYINVDEYSDGIFKSKLTINTLDVLSDKDCLINYQLENSKKELLNNIVKSTVCLKDIALVSFGVKFYQVNKGTPKQTREIVANHSFTHDFKINQSCKKILEGKNIERYTLTEGKKWIEYGNWLAEPRKLELFEGDRLLLRRIVGKGYLISTFVDGDYCNNSLLHTVKVLDKEISTKYLLSILNSRLIGFYFITRYARDEKTFPEIRIHELESLPIRKAANQGVFVSYVNMILAQKQNNPLADTSTLEQQIDLLVYKLYELSYEEVLLIEPDFGQRVSVEEYAMIEID